MSDRAIQEAVQQLTGGQLKDAVSLLVVTVTAVNIDGRTCDGTAVTGTGVTDILGIELMASASDGLLLLPSIGSNVIVAYSTRNIPCVVMFSDLDEVQIYTGGSFIDIKAGLMSINATNVNITATNATITGQTQLNDGSFGGLVESAPLVARINILEDRIRSLIIYVNFIKTYLGIGAFPDILPTPGTSLARKDIENTRITHGI